MKNGWSGWEEWRRAVQLFRLFRKEQADPDAFYTFLAEDTVRQIMQYCSLRDACVVDIGGGPGFMTDALSAAGSQCVVVDYSATELGLHGRTQRAGIVGDGRALPIAGGSIAVVVSSNVLEHVDDPIPLLKEASRVLRAGGIAYIAFTNWYSPWGGHETSPWHYCGGGFALRRYDRTHAAPAKNRYGTSLYPVHIGPTVAWARSEPSIELIDVFPRYWPRAFRGIVRLPGLREVLTWNVVLVFRRAGTIRRNGEGD